MKKSNAICVSFVLLFLLPLAFPLNGVSKNKTSNAPKNQDKSIVINVTGVEYDEPALNTLRGVLDGNVKIKKISPSYSNGVAKLSFLYPGKATELWDELPVSTKQSFKVTAIDDSHIELQLKSSTKITETTKANTTVPASECIDCIYYKNCKFDTTVVFNSVSFQGNKKSGSFYRCENGVLSAGYTDAVSKKFETQVIFRSNDPVGKLWTDASYSGLITHVTLAKGIALKINNLLYPDVMMVHGNYSGKNSYCFYYVKGSGWVKTDTLDVKFNAVNAAKLKGEVDQSVVGIWKSYNKLVDMNLFYKFNGDGTYEYYVGEINKANQYPKGKCYWRINGNMLELFYADWPEVIRIRMQKKNDNATGKPTLVIQYNDTEDKVYFSETGVLPWK